MDVRVLGHSGGILSNSARPYHGRLLTIFFVLNFQLCLVENFYSSDLCFSINQVVGVAHALNLLFGVELSTGVFLAAIDAFLFPVFASFLV